MCHSCGPEGNIFNHNALLLCIQQSTIFIYTLEMNTYIIYIIMYIYINIL